MSDYNLVYTCKTSGKKYEVKRVTAADFRIKDPETGVVESISSKRLRNKFKSSKENKRRKFQTFCNRPLHLRKVTLPSEYTNSGSANERFQSRLLSQGNGQEVFGQEDYAV